MGLLKKAAELNILCDIQMTILFKDLCGKVVCYSSSNMENNLESMDSIDIHFSEKNYPDFSTRNFQRKKRLEFQQEMLNKFLPKIENGESLKKLKRELNEFIPTYNLDNFETLPLPQFDSPDTEEISDTSNSSLTENNEIPQEFPLKRYRPDQAYYLGDQQKPKNLGLSFEDLFASSAKTTKKADNGIFPLSSNMNLFRGESKDKNAQEMYVEEELYNGYYLFDPMNYI